MSVWAEAMPAAIAHSVRIQSVSDRSVWDRAVENLGGSILQSWNWGEFKSRHGWQPFRMLGERDGRPIIGAQVLCRQIGPMSLLYVPRGPVFGEIDSAVWSALTLSIDRLGQQQRSAITFIEPDESPRVRPPAEGELGWDSSAIELQPLRTIKVPVDRDDDEILAAMKSKTRYNVRLAGRRGVWVRQGTERDIAPFYELLTETSERDAFGIHSIEYYADMLDVFGDAGVLLLAEYEGEIAAGAIVLQHDDEAVYMFGASSQKHQRHMPTHLLQFEAMRWARDRGCSRYDLWGIPPTDTPPDEAQNGEMNVRSGLWGVYRFKQGFGGDIVSYPGVLERAYYPLLVNLWRRLRPGLGA